MAEPMSGFNIVGKKSRVSEELFWEIFRMKVSELTEGTDKFDKIYHEGKECLLNSKKSLTVVNICFWVTGKE